MKIENYKKYTIPIIGFLLLLIMLGYSAFIYFGWDKKTDKPKYSVEVSLPIIDWDRYSNLSKQYE